MPYVEMWVEPEPCEELHLEDKEARRLVRAFDLLRRAELPRALRIEVTDALDLLQPLVNRIDRHFVVQQRTARQIAAKIAAKAAE